MPASLDVSSIVVVSALLATAAFAESRPTPIRASIERLALEPVLAESGGVRSDTAGVRVAGSVRVGADRVRVGADGVGVGADGVRVGADRIRVGGDRIRVGGDRIRVGAGFSRPTSAALHPVAKGALIGAAVGAGGLAAFGLWYCTAGPGECSGENWRRGLPIWMAAGAAVGALIGAVR